MSAAQKQNGDGPIRRGQRTPFKKCTEAERDERVEKLANYWDRHPLATQGELKKFGRDRFKLKYWMVGKYIARAKKFRVERARMPKRDTADLCISTLLQIVHSGSERGKIQAVAQLCAIAGIEAAKRLEHTGAAGGPMELKHHDVTRLSRERAEELVRWAEQNGAVEGSKVFTEQETFSQWCDQVRAEAKRRGCEHLLPGNLGSWSARWRSGQTPQQVVTVAIGEPTLGDGNVEAGQ